MNLKNHGEFFLSFLCLTSSLNRNLPKSKDFCFFLFLWHANVLHCPTLVCSNCLEAISSRLKKEGFNPNSDRKRGQHTFFLLQNGENRLMDPSAISHPISGFQWHRQTMFLIFWQRAEPCFVTTFTGLVWIHCMCSFGPWILMPLVALSITCPVKVGSGWAKGSHQPRRKKWSNCKLAQFKLQKIFFVSSMRKTCMIWNKCTIERNRLVNRFELSGDHCTAVSLLWLLEAQQVGSSDLSPCRALQHTVPTASMGRAFLTNSGCRIPALVPQIVPPDFDSRSTQDFPWWYHLLQRSHLCRRFPCF